MKAWCKRYAAFLLALAGALIAEGILFNFPFWLTRLNGLAPQWVSADALFASDGEVQPDGSVTVHADSYLIDYTIGIPVRSVRIRTAAQNRAYSFECAILDDAYRAGYRMTDPFLSHTDLPDSQTVRVHSNGRAHAFAVHFLSDAEGLTVTGIELNAKSPFRLYPLRLLAVFGLLLLGILTLRRRWYARAYDPDCGAHRAGYALHLTLALLFCAFTLLTSVPDASLDSFVVPREGTDGTAYGDPYIQQADAFGKGQLFLDLPVDDRLFRLDNPYDPSQRDVAEVSYFYDRAFYNGRYYSYYGVAPVLTVYLPMLWLTGQYPAVELVCLLYGLGFVLFTYLAVRRLILYLFPRPNLLLTHLTPLAVVFASNALWCVRTATFYEIAPLAGLCFLMLSIFCMVRAMTARAMGWFALCGLAFGLAVASRATFVLYALLLAPCFLQYLLDKTVPPAVRCRTLAAFALPVALCAGGLLWFNAARFSGPLDFGAAYNLTISDVSAYSAAQLSGIFPTVYHYLLQLPTLNLQFPFVRISGMGQVFFRNYYYCWPTVGALAFPCNWLLFAAPAAGKRRSPLLRQTLLLGLLVPLLLCYLTFSLGGVFIRYTADVYFCFALTAGLVALSLADRQMDRKTVLLPALALLAAALLGFFLSFAGHFATFRNDAPRLFVLWKYAMEWWL